MPEAGDELPRVIAVPSDRLWLDPPFVARRLYTQITDVDAGAVPPPQLVGFNSARWAIGFTMSPLGVGNAVVAPWSDMTTGAGLRVDNDALLWFTLTLHGPLVTGEWYGSGSAGLPIRVVEVIRQT